MSSVRRPLLPAPSSHGIAQVAVDLASLTAALLVAFFLRFDGQPPWVMLKRALVLGPYVVAFQYAVLAGFGVPQFAWRYIGLREALRTFAALSAAAVVLLVVSLARPALEQVHVAFHWTMIPRGVIAIDLALATAGIVGARVVRRLVFERRARAARAEGARPRRRTLVVGAGDEGAALLRTLAQHPELGLEPIGVVDDDRSTHDARIVGVPVLGEVAEAPGLAASLHADLILVALGPTPRPVMRRLLASLEGASVPVQVLPPVETLVQGSPLTPRPVSIQDLLRRSVVDVAAADVGAAVRGKVVLVTGAGGSIGSELCRQLLRSEPAKLVLVEQSEHALYEIERELADPRAEAALVDVTDAGELDALFARTRPSLVFHAAAHKHVPMLERNVRAAVRNNVLGTKLVAEAAIRHRTDAFILVSTDKAVNPTSVMGATKRVAEQLVKTLAGRSSTRCCAVRFGNVLGSSGSVVPLFQEQIARGGPVTVTHPDVRRYFMTIPEAASLVIAASTLGHDGEILLLDMGEPVRIVDLAEDLIRLSGHVPHRDIAITFTGLRPGEKLFEELSVDAETARPTRHPMIHVVRMRDEDRDRTRAAIDGLLHQADEGAGEADLRGTLARLVPEATLGAPPTPSA